MALYAGEAVRIRTEVIDPVTEQPLDPPPTGATVEFWGPGRNPAKDPGVRTSPDIAANAMTYDAEESAFIAYVNTSDNGSGEVWEAGKWSFRVTVTGDVYTNWEYGTFSLKA